jgi:predicted ATPase
MNMFESLRIRGFRRLADMNLGLRRLNVMIGANGCGKTSLLDAFSLLAASAVSKLRSSVNEIGGVDSNLSQFSFDVGGKASKLEFELSQIVPGFAPVDYKLAIESSGASYQISEERLSQYSDPSKPTPMIYLDSSQRHIRFFDIVERRLKSPDWDVDPSESALCQVGKMYPQIERFRATLASSTHYHALDVGRRAPVRLPQQMREATLPGKDGEDLVTCLYWMREANQDRFEIIEDTLRVAFPSFERLNFPPVASGMLALTWKDKQAKQPFYLHQLSEGTIRFLWLITLLYSPGLTEVTLLDEPEVSLHPELLGILADCLREASKRTQLIVATHADRLVRYLEPSEIITFEVDDGTSIVRRAEELDLKAWLEDYTLDQIWSQGLLGGRS